MKEIKSILGAYAKINFAERKAAMATVVRVKGSSYRSPGARMLITDDGRWVGSISGGCLEGDALRKARQVMYEGAPLTVRYDTREESNQNLGIGLGCNGLIDVLIEPVNDQDDPSIKLFNHIAHSNRAFHLATIISPLRLAGAKTLIGETGDLLMRPDGQNLSEHFFQKVRSACADSKSKILSIQDAEGEIEVFLELIQPSISLIIFGGGFDARPVSQLAHSLGWRVTVTDECVAHIAPIFFPGADNLSLCHRSFIDRDFSIGAYTACVLMSHNYEYDRDVLRKLLNSESPYIGILGPRKRFDKMKNELEAEGIEFTSKDADRIHSPIGLDIGAETPDEIALSIIGEIQSKFARRSGGFLKYRSGPIHGRHGLEDEVFKEIYLSGPHDKAIGSTGTTN